MAGTIYVLTMSSSFERTSQQGTRKQETKRYLASMFRVIGLVYVLITKVHSYPAEDFNNNGWKPLSTEQVLNLHGKLIMPVQTASTIPHWSPVFLAEENTRNTVFNTNVKPYDIKRELIKNIDYMGIDEQQINVELPENEQSFNTKYAASDKTKIIHENFPENRRQAKNIIGNQENNMNILHNNKNKNIVDTDILENVKMDVTSIENDKSNIYEVTEVSEASEITDLNLDQTQTNENKSYFKPDIKTTTDKSLSNILFTILRNYNIRINDDLTNYALSKKQQNSNTSNQGYSYRAPITTQQIRNSENYLPLDPFLAVFLSNYGFYLPGYFGYPGNYNNIYGYLASNNIHNNKPFGAYIMYSDTDSSN